MSANKYVDQNGLLYVKQKIQAWLLGKVDKVEGKGLSTNDYTTVEKEKLSGIAAGANAYVHPAATIAETVVRSVTFPEPSATNVSMSGYDCYECIFDNTGHATERRKTGNVGGWVLDAATNANAGVMSAADKTKLDGIAAGANAYVHPTVTMSQHTSNTPVTAVSSDGGVSFSNNKNGYGFDSAGHIVSSQNMLSSVAINNATQSANGVMSSTDKAKLDAFGAASTYALKSDITSMYRYKGSVAAVANLPTSNNTTGDVYNVEASGMNYAWDGTEWDALGEIFTITSLTNAEIDTIMA